MLSNEQIFEQITDRYPSAIIHTEYFRYQFTLILRREDFKAAMALLKNELEFDFLVDVTAADYLKMNRQPRFEVVYHLRSMKHGNRLRVKVPVPEEDCRIDSVVSLWNSANWLERETAEMYGITFTGHPDPRKLLMPETFTDFPLRKDYPLRGKGEREKLFPEGT